MKESIQRVLREIYLQQADTLAAVSTVITPHAEVIADTFYQALLKDERAAAFLDNKMVDERLHRSMQHWIAGMLAPLDEAGFDAHVQRQIEIGHVHARVNIPMPLVQQGVRILKREFCSRLVDSSMPRAELSEAVLIVNDLLDTAALLINDSYISDIMDNERKAQSMRLHMTNHNLAIECEQLRSELFDWSRRMIPALFANESHSCGGDQVCHSDFGLWVTHKAELLFPENDDVRKLHQQLEVIDVQLKRAREERAEGLSEAFQQAVASLNEAVTQAAWLLSELVEHTMEQENVRDPLTRLLNRRYLPSIIQREVHLSIQHHRPFAALMIDIDHFKALNDNHGHPAGDMVLSHFSELLLTTLRTSDFIFRYGGEEFLVLISDSSLDEAALVAEKLRRNVEQHSFHCGETELQVTCSIGVALHDGHPDYSMVLKQADEALYQAKQGGRNCYCLAGELEAA